jgi:type IV pilus assembly protein PilF
MRTNNIKDAEGYFMTALRQEPNDLGSLLPLADIRYRQGNLEDARRLTARFNKLIELTAESLWLALRIERKLGERTAEASFANQLLQRGEYD